MGTPVAARAHPVNCRNVIKPSPFLSASASAARLYNNVIKERCAWSTRACRPLVLSCSSNVSYNPGLSSNLCSRRSYKQHALSTGTPLYQLSSTSSSFICSEKEVLSQRSFELPRQNKSLMVPRGAARDAFGVNLPKITVKPEWWWRTLACIPYLIALQISDVGFYIQPFAEKYELFENLIFFVPGAISRLPSWFTMVYCYVAYIGIVKNKDWPHFFRFHLMMGMLLETSMQIVWYTCNFLPLIHYHGTFGMHFWMGIGFAYIVVLLMCVKSALAGSYVQFPMVTEAACIHTLYNIGSFHRPF